MSYNDGYPYNNLALAILAEAKKEPDCTMWQDFRRVYYRMQRNYDTDAIAGWVGDWLIDNYQPGKMRICPECELPTQTTEKKCDICGKEYI